MQGKIIEYVDQGRFYCALVLLVQGKKLRIMNQNGKEMNMPVARVVHQSSQTHPAPPSREELMRMLQEVAGKRQGMIDMIDLEEVWELVVEEDQTVFTPRFLADLCFGDNAADDQEAAFMRAVFSDRLFFRFKAGKIQVHSRETVEQLREKAEQEEARQELMDRGALGLKAIMAGDIHADWEDRQKCLDMIKDFYLHGSDAPEYELAKDLLKKAGLSRPHDPFHLLIKAGIWQKDENIALLKEEIPVDFDGQLLEKVGQVEEPDGESLVAGGCRDFRDLPLMTIDGEFTRDFDDALHIEKKSDGNYLVGIHIADVSEFVKPDDDLYREARQRGTSLYFPDQHVPMLPRELSEGACSLIQGKVRPAISCLVQLTPKAEVVDFRMVRSVVRVKRRITYNQAEELLSAGSDDELQCLADLSAGLLARRVENGALVIPIPDVNISVGNNGKVQVRLAEVDTRSRVLVAEFMVLANMLSAQYLADREVPALYRCQEPPRKRLSQGIARDLFTNFRQRRFLSRGNLLTEPKQHSGVGAQQYTTITSPIRRMLDLAMQQQLSSVLQGKGPLYTLNDCRDIQSAIMTAQARAGKVRQLRHRYWLFKYLASEVGVGGRVEVLVLEIQPRRIQVVLTNVLLEGDLPLNQGYNVSPGDIIKVKLARVSPLDNSFRLEW